MKKSYILFKCSYLLTIIIAVSLLLMNGCKDEDNPSDGGTGDTIPNNIFPLVTGHRLIYGQGSLLLLSSTTPIPGSDVGFNSSWTIAGPAPNPLPEGRSATMIIDTTNVPGVGVTNAIRLFFIDQDSATGNFDFLTNLGFLFRSQKVYNTPGDSTSGIRGDSLVWIDLAQPGKGIGNEYVAYTQNYTTATFGPIRFEVVAEFTEKSKMTISGTEYDVYKIVATRKIYLGTSTTAASTGKTAEIWLAPNVGPVYIELIGDEESHGKKQTMTSKNF